MSRKRKADGDLPNGSGDAIRARFDGPYIDPECAAELNAALDGCFDAVSGPDFRERLLAAAGFVRDWPKWTEWLRECGDTRARELAGRIYDTAGDSLEAAAVQLGWDTSGLALVLEAARADAWRPRLPGELPLSCRTAAALAMEIAARVTAADRPAGERRGAREAAGPGPDGRGYVASPSDPAAYVPAGDILAKYTPADLPISTKELGTILEDYDTNRVRWTRPRGKNGQPVPNRRSVHLGDWVAYLKRRTNPESEGFARLSATELERRKAAVRNARHPGK